MCDVLMQLGILHDSIGLHMNQFHKGVVFLLFVSLKEDCTVPESSVKQDSEIIIIITLPIVLPFYNLANYILWKKQKILM